MQPFGAKTRRLSTIRCIFIYQVSGLRLVTARVPEKSSPFGPGLNQLPLLRVRRSSTTERSRKLTAYGAMLDPPTAGAASSPRSVFWDLRLKGDRTVVARFVSASFPLPDSSAVED